MPLRILSLSFLCPVACSIAQPLDAKPEDSRPAAVLDFTSKEKSATLDYIELPEGFELSLWAEASMLSTPAALSFDNQGRLFVAETHRDETRAEDTRDEEKTLGRQTTGRPVQDRERLIDEASEGAAARTPDTAVNVRLIEDTDANGVADASHVLAAGFDASRGGTATDIRADGDRIWLSRMHSLSKLIPDASGDRIADEEEVLRGFGIDAAASSHGLHGLAVGPDGKVYFSVGDRGARVVTKEGQSVQVTDTGAVFRCRPDGTSLEIVATGLRNPQDLVFDDFGNLFTGDSDSGHGDMERLVYVVEGSDSGWHAGFQHALLGEGGAWMREGLWKPHFKNQPAHILPPVCNIEDGPSGMAAHPGTGLGNNYNGAFFLCHFNGSPSNSGIQTYSLRAEGAGFEVTDSTTFLRGALPRDVTFGPDGRLYFADWVSGWHKYPAGRIYAVETSHPDASNRALAEETRLLIAEGMNDRSSKELTAFLGNRDRRVRLAAQFALAGRGEDGLPVLQSTAENPEAPRLARLHALWGMGQLAESVPSALNPLPPLLKDKDGEVRSQAARLIGDYFRIEYFQFLVAALQDPEPRVAFFSAQSLGKLRRKLAIPYLIGLLRRNNDKDVVLRHAVAIALARLGPDPALANTVNDESRAVRLGGLLTYRRLEDPMVASFLQDFDPYLVREAARAINDVPIEDAMPALAGLLESAPLDDHALVLRAINAHFRLGKPENAQALADFAGRPYVPAAFRAEALNQLALWEDPPARDRLSGLLRPLAPRASEPARGALGSFLSQLSGNASEEIQIATIRAVTALKTAEAGHALWDVVYQKTHPVAARIAALEGLEKTNDLRLEVAAQTAGRSDETELRQAALHILSRFHPAVSLPTLGFLADNGTAREQSTVFSILAGIDDPRADEILIKAMRRLAAGRIPIAAPAELLEAASAKENPELAAILGQLQKDWHASGDRLEPYQFALDGGDAISGQELYQTHPVLECARCHENWQRTPDSGPLLAGIGKLRTKRELLESVLFPNERFSPGFEVITLTLREGETETGTVLKEDDSHLELHRRNGTAVMVAKAQITKRDTMPSSMPDDVGQVLSPAELRDLIAYLSDLKEAPGAAFSRPRALATIAETPAQNW